MNNYTPYWDCHGLFKPSQWRCGGTVITRSKTTKQSINHCLFIHLQKRKRIPWMSNCTPYWDCHGFLKRIPWMSNCTPYWDCHGFFKASQWRCWGTVIARSETTKQSINHKNHHQKQKRKEITIIYQVKELIFNEILIFNFQFSISYGLPRVAKQLSQWRCVGVLSLRAKRSNP